MYRRKNYDATRFAAVLGASVNEIKRYHKTLSSDLLKGTHMANSYVHDVLHGSSKVSPAHYLSLAHFLMEECYDVKALDDTRFRLAMGLLGFVIENDFRTSTPAQGERQNEVDACCAGLCSLEDKQMKCKLQLERFQKYLEAREEEVLKLVNQKLREQEVEQRWRANRPDLFLTPAEGMMISNLQVALKRQEEIEALAASLHDRMVLLQDRVDEYLDQYYSEPE